MTRVSLLGPLSASTAHQLNQPLTSILSNAEAAQKLLARDPVGLAALREICNDIVAEDHRAADVIRSLGALFKRGEPMLVRLDLNELVRDALDLTRTSLLTRHVTPRVRLAPRPAEDRRRPGATAATAAEPDRQCRRRDGGHARVRPATHDPHQPVGRVR